MINVVKVKNKNSWNVFMNRKIIGQITMENCSYQYFPKGDVNGSPTYQNLNYAIESVEELIQFGQ